MFSFTHLSLYLNRYLNVHKVSLEAPLYSLTVVKNNAISDDRDSLIFRYCINVENGNNFGFWENAPKTSGFSLKDGLECFNTWSNTNVHSVIFKCEIEFTREPDNNMNRQTSFLLTSNRPFLNFFNKLASTTWFGK